MSLLDQNYWNDRYRNEQTGWDLGQPAPPIENYFKHLPSESRDLRLLIPGCGNAHEAGMLLEQGYRNLTLVDIAPEACKAVEARFPDYIGNGLQVVCADFFDFEGGYDLVVEHTFFCALEPDLRKRYVEKMQELIVPGGLLVGLLFASEFDFPGPPFGGTLAEYRLLFEPRFEILYMEPARDSAKPRAGNELFVRMRRR